MAQHGFARTSEWDLTDTVVDEDLVRAVFHLTDSEATRKVWPHPFLLSYTLSLTAKALTTSLRIQNVGPEPFEAQALLHTYLRLGAVDKAGVHGLGKHPFIDKVDPSPEGTDLPVDGRDVATIDKVRAGGRASWCRCRPDRLCACTRTLSHFPSLPNTRNAPGVCRRRTACTRRAPTR